MSENSNKSGGGGGCGCSGCLSIILFVLIVWALLFGVTVNNRRYNIGCSTDRGVVIE